MKPGTLCITVDVEDWFQAENLRRTHPPRSWDDRELRAEASTHRVLEVLDGSGVKGTFFILGWIARRIPRLVRTIADAGHEVASHGHGHIISFELSGPALRQDIESSRGLLEDLAGGPVIGYRAPCFSISDGLLEMLADAGYRYDSSLNPFATHDRYGAISVPASHTGSFIHSSGIVEFPMPMGKLFGVSLPISGGGYFRLYPYPLFRAMVKKHLDRTGLYVFYMHPWEVDHRQPRTPVANPFHRFRHYWGLSGTLGKLKKLVTLEGEKRTLGDVFRSGQ